MSVRSNSVECDSIVALVNWKAMVLGRSVLSEYRRAGPEMFFTQSCLSMRCCCSAPSRGLCGVLCVDVQSGTPGGAPDSWTPNRERQGIPLQEGDTGSPKDQGGQRKKASAKGLCFASSSSCASSSTRDAKKRAFPARIPSV